MAWYDPLQRLTQVKDALGRITQLDWCGCGSLSGLIDPLGRVTSWVRDIQGRVTGKIYPDGTGMAYKAKVVLQQLRLRCGELAPEACARVSALPLEGLESSAEALLDFRSAADLECWLQSR